LDDVADQVAEKLVRRHPYVFNQAQDPLSAAESHRRWDKIKEAEKNRQSVLDGIPQAQPALARAQKVLARARRADLAVPFRGGDGLGAQLLELVRHADAEGVDAEGALRAALRELEADVKAAEAAAANTPKEGQTEC
jgi:XTP/dITP diphosphohydrolase